MHAHAQGPMIAAIMLACGPEPYRIEVAPDAAPWAVAPDLRTHVDAIETCVRITTPTHHPLDGWTIHFTGEPLTPCGDGFALGCCSWGDHEIHIPTALFNSAERSSLGHEIAHVLAGPGTEPGFTFCAGPDLCECWGAP